MRCPNRFSPVRIRSTEFRNRIFSTGHDTYLPEGGLPSPALIAYQAARARGGAGLIIIQVVGVHETARYTGELLMGTNDDCIPSYRELIGTLRALGTKVFVQLFHPGRELLGRPEGVIQPAYAPSFSPSERFRTVPRPMSSSLIEEIIEGYAAVAGRMAEAGADGVEIVASHGYLPAQFLNPKVNRRDDRYGGSLENRLRFTTEVIASIRKAVPETMIVGIRFSGDELDVDGLGEDETIAMARLIKDEADYLNVIAGTSAASAGAVHIVPPMTVGHAYLAPYARKLKQATGAAVFVAGRINQPHEAERIITEGSADMCGMTRAMICDPEMANKAREGLTDDIRACIGCNQACIGHFQLGLPISCIQYPETGRELLYAVKPKAPRQKKVMVAGGGPAGLKAAAVAAERGHEVMLYEREPRLGGQALVAQLLPGRAEFGGIVTNLTREAERAGVKIVKSRAVTAELVAAEGPDAVILATGSRPYAPPIEGGARASNIVHACDVLAGRATTGASVVIYDWLADWIGAGVAEKLALDGVHVRLAVNGICPAVNIQNYIRDVYIAKLHRLGVTVLPMMRLFGIEGTTAYFLHTAAQEAVVMENVDTLVLACPNAPEDGLAAQLQPLVENLQIIGDCLAPRTAEEAVFEGLKAGMAL
jgi:2,4-dienoyl-CoA reductase-like NADH-dependent reductase (Old Yellow Enzyme family)